MKIGILTFHSQLNYISPEDVGRAAAGRRHAGCGVLQFWALQQALVRMLSEKSKARVEVEKRADQLICEVRRETLGTRKLWTSRDERFGSVRAKGQGK